MSAVREVALYAQPKFAGDPVNHQISPQRFARPHMELREGRAVVKIVRGGESANSAEATLRLIGLTRSEGFAAG